MNYSSVHHPTTRFYYRNEIISYLDHNYHLLSHICTNLYNYIQAVRKQKEGTVPYLYIYIHKYIYMCFHGTCTMCVMFIIISWCAVNPDLDPEALCIDGRFNHSQQCQIRLDFLR